MNMRSWKGLMLGLCALGCCHAGAQEAAFPYPDLPPTVKDEQQAVGYMLEHFWAQYDFTDTTAVNRHVGEQGFVDFIALMKHADAEVGAKAAQAFAQHFEEDSTHIEELIDHYLGNPRSPMCNDIVYAQLLRALPPSPQRAYRRRMIEKNQVGRPAADFTFSDNTGSKRRLYDTRSSLTLVVFYDDTCEECRHALPLIKADATLQRQAYRLKTIYVQPDEQMERQQPYYLPVLPALYLLDANKKVLIKNGTLQQVTAYLLQH